MVEASRQKTSQKLCKSIKNKTNEISYCIPRNFPIFSTFCGVQCTYLSLSETKLTRFCRCRLAAIDEWCWLLCTAAGLNLFGLSSLRGFFDMVLFFEHFFKEHNEICGKPAEVDDSETTWSSPTKVCLIYKAFIDPFHTALCYVNTTRTLKYTLKIWFVKLAQKIWPPYSYANFRQISKGNKIKCEKLEKTKKWCKIKFGQKMYDL